MADVIKATQSMDGLGMNFSGTFPVGHLLQKEGVRFDPDYFRPYRGADNKSYLQIKDQVMPSEVPAPLTLEQWEQAHRAAFSAFRRTAPVSCGLSQFVNYTIEAMQVMVLEYSVFKGSRDGIYDRRGVPLPVTHASAPADEVVKKVGYVDYEAIEGAAAAVGTAVDELMLGRSTVSYVYGGMVLLGLLSEPSQRPCHGYEHAMEMLNGLGHFGPYLVVSGGRLPPPRLQNRRLGQSHPEEHVREAITTPLLRPGDGFVVQASRDVIQTVFGCGPHLIYTPGEEGKRPAAFHYFTIIVPQFRDRTGVVPFTYRPEEESCPQLIGSTSKTVG